MVTLPEVGGVVAAGVVFTDCSTGDMVSGKLVVTGGSGVVVYLEKKKREKEKTEEVPPQEGHVLCS